MLFKPIAIKNGVSNMWTTLTDGNMYCKKTGCRGIITLVYFNSFIFNAKSTI